MNYAAPAENSNTLELLKFYQCCFHFHPKHTHSQTHTPYTDHQDMKYSLRGFLGHISMMYKKCKMTCFNTYGNFIMNKFTGLNLAFEHCCWSQQRSTHEVQDNNIRSGCTVLTETYLWNNITASIRFIYVSEYGSEARNVSQTHRKLNILLRKHTDSWQCRTEGSQCCPFP